MLFLSLLLFPTVPAFAMATDSKQVFKVRYAFSTSPEEDCEIELTADSVRFLKDSFLELDQFVGGRALTPPERDSAEAFKLLSRRFKGYRRFICGPGDAEGYAYSLWSDSLLLSCENCYSCNSGVTLPEARDLARLGKMSLWLYGLREGWLAKHPGAFKRD